MKGILLFPVYLMIFIIVVSCLAAPARADDLDTKGMQQLVDNIQEEQLVRDIQRQIPCSRGNLPNRLLTPKPAHNCRIKEDRFAESRALADSWSTYNVRK